MEYFFQILFYVFKHCPATGMKKCDEASPSIIFAGRALLVKKLVTLEPDGIFGSNFVYLSILALSSHWYDQRTIGPVNAHLISWPSKAQNIQNLENIW